MRSDDALDDKDIMWAIYPRLHGSMTPDDMTKGRIAFRSSYLTSAAVNTRVVRLHDEVKFELPLYITRRHISCLRSMGFLGFLQKKGLMQINVISRQL